MEPYRPYATLKRLKDNPQRAEIGPRYQNGGHRHPHVDPLPARGPRLPYQEFSLYDDDPMIGDLFENDEAPLDEFDRQLLSPSRTEPEPRSEHGLTETSLTTKAQNGLMSSIPRTPRDDLLNTPAHRFTSSSSPLGSTSSPTVLALQNRPAIPKLRRKSLARGKPQVQASLGPQPLALGHAVPQVQGISLVPATDLPDRYRSVFSFPIFNAVQSKCFAIAFGTNDNLVLSAPTGSGKTVVLEFAICQLVSSCTHSNFKIVYQAPTKALCAERHRDWQKKFLHLDLQCAELTGDTESEQLRSIQKARIIITTPEKWDSVSRKWKDNSKLMEMVRLFLIDEVHILKDSRGATLEAVVSRMKSVGSKVRLVALSATIPNSDDVAVWLGRNSECTHLPAHLEVFGEEFRPVRLQKVVKSYPSGGNDWAYENMLSAKYEDLLQHFEEANDFRIPEIIAQYSLKKPVMIFCVSRASATKMSSQLAHLWRATTGQSQLWHGPKRAIQVNNLELQGVVSAGVAFHHGGLAMEDRQAVEQGFLNGNITILCSTSTLAVGVNLPCYLVIVKGTMGWTQTGLKEYPDLEMIQMLGRAGRPQFETSACAVILTREGRVTHYQKMVSGQEILESCLHQNLVEHLNAEIALGSIYDLASAKRWLRGSFLFVRIRQNPDNYKLDDNINQDAETSDDVVERISEKDVRLLQENGLVSPGTRFRATELGDAMARYCVKFDTMKMILSLPPKAKVSEILSVLAEAAEFKDIRLKANERALYRELNKDSSVKYPLRVNVALSSHKTSLLIQTELGACLFPSAETFRKLRTQYQLDKSAVFSHVNRLVRCIIDCQLHYEDSVSTRHALELGRSLAARVWDNSSLELKQIEGIGDVGIRKLASAGVNSIEALANTEAHRIEMILSRNPPFGNKILSNVAGFPNLRISVKQIARRMQPKKGVCIDFKAEVGFMNEALPIVFRQKPVYVCFLAETSDGKLIDFRRMNSKKVENYPEILLSTLVTRPTTCINCFVSCDEIAGTSRKAELKIENLPIGLFSHVDKENSKSDERDVVSREAPRGNENVEDDFNQDHVGDAELLSVEVDGRDAKTVQDIDDLMVDQKSSNEVQSSRKRPASCLSCTGKPDEAGRTWREPTQLDNGRWTCQHSCGDEGKSCKHKCCAEGVAKPGRRPAKQVSKRIQSSNSCFPEASVARPSVDEPIVDRYSPVQHVQKRRKSPAGRRETEILEDLHNATRISNSNFSSGSQDRRRLRGLSEKLPSDLETTSDSSHLPICRRLASPQKPNSPRTETPRPVDVGGSIISPEGRFWKTNGLSTDPDSAVLKCPRRRERDRPTRKESCDKDGIRFGHFVFDNQDNNPYFALDDDSKFKSLDTAHAKGKGLQKCMEPRLLSDGRFNHENSNFYAEGRATPIKGSHNPQPLTLLTDDSQQSFMNDEDNFSDFDDGFLQRLFNHRTDRDEHTHVGPGSSRDKGWNVSKEERLYHPSPETRKLSPTTHEQQQTASPTNTNTELERQRREELEKAEEEEEQRKKWDGIKLLPGLENLDQYVELV